MPPPSQPDLRLSFSLPCAPRGRVREEKKRGRQTTLDSLPTSSRINAGVTNTPSTLPLAALKTAAASLPLAVPVSMTHIETVVGRHEVMTSLEDTWRAREAQARARPCSRTPGSHMCWKVPLVGWWWCCLVRVRKAGPPSAASMGLFPPG